MESMKETFESDDGDEDGGEDFSRSDDQGVLWCPAFGAEMYGDSTRCPTCGDYVTPGPKPSAFRSWWRVPSAW